MIWLTWRQFRAQALTAAAALAVLAAVFAATGPHLARLYAASGLAACRAQAHAVVLAPGSCAARTVSFLGQVKSDPVYPALYVLGAALLWIAPAIIGAFWGAPLVTRELEAGTFRLAWNQSVTRTRWLAVKLGLVGLAAMATAGLLSLMVTWWAAPIDRAGGLPVGLGQLSRFAPQLFAARDITPVGYAAFAVALGVAAGVLIRRTVPAMAVTLAVFAAVQLLTPGLVRPHLIPPAQATAAVRVNLSSVQMSSNGQVTVPVTNRPGAWIITNQTITPAGRVFVLPVVAACQSGSQQQCDAWYARQHLRRRITYLPASRYWPLQWYETAIFLALAAALAGACAGQVRYRRLS